MNSLRARIRSPSKGLRSVPVRMRSVAQCHGDCVRHEGQQALSFRGRQLYRKTSIEHDHHPILAHQMRCHERHAPTVDDHVVMRERPGERDLKHRIQRLIINHDSVFNIPAVDPLANVHLWGSGNE